MIASILPVFTAEPPPPPFFLVLLVNDSEYNNFTGTQPIPCHCGIYFVLPLARYCCSCGSCWFLLLLLRAPPPQQQQQQQEMQRVRPMGPLYHIRETNSPVNADSLAHFALGVRGVGATIVDQNKHWRFSFEWQSPAL